MMRRIALALAAVILAATGIGYWWLRTSLPQTSGTVALTGLKGPVDVVRDENAVPHIFATNSNDAYFALGYAHAQDRLWQMELLRRVGAGRLAEVLGEEAIPVDRFIRTLGLYRFAQAIEERLTPDLRAVFEAYAVGVNAWLSNRSGALPIEFIVLGFEPEPWQITDSLVWSRLIALRQGRNRENEMLRGRIASALATKGLPPVWLDELWPEEPPSSPTTLDYAESGLHPLLEQAWSAMPAELRPNGASNAWAIHGSLTESGKPILANDPHLGFGAPGLWYLARIDAPELHLTGATVPGVPLTLIGHNGHISWGITTAYGDAEDLFVETVDPQDAGRYLSPSGSLPFVTRQEVIRVKGADPVIITARATRHGPVISDVSHDAAEAAAADQVVAYATPALRPDDSTVEAVLALNRARSWREFLAATAGFQTPNMNLVFASTSGDIGMVSPGRLPVRKAGDGRMPVPGADGEYDWTGFIPAEERPRAHNPASGRLVNANNRIVDDSYGHLMTRDWAMPFRAMRIVDVLDKQALHSGADSQALQRDVLSVPARRLLPLMLRVTPQTERGRHAVALLSSWNFEMRRELVQPLIYAAWLRQLVAALADDEIGEKQVADYLGLIARPGPLFVEEVLTRQEHWCDDVGTPQTETCPEILALTLERALNEIAGEFGADMTEWRWGEAHKATFTHPVLTHVPILAGWADLSIASDGGDFTVNAGTSRGGRPGTPFEHVIGAGFRAIYDLSNLDRSLFAIATGQSGNPLSPHYSDMLRRWRDGRYIRIAGSRDELTSRAIGTLQLMPARRP